MDNATEAFNAESIRSNCPPSLAHLSLASLLGPGLSFEKRKQPNTGSIVYPGTVQDTEILKWKNVLNNEFLFQTVFHRGWRKTIPNSPEFDFLRDYSV